MFTGVIPILQTAFSASGDLDLASMARQCEFACDAGVPAVAYPGFVSEWWKLHPAEIREAAVVIRQQTRGRCCLILNVTAQSTHHAVREAQDFASIGADGLMCLPPFVVPSGSDALLCHLRAVLAATNLPHVLQYSASLTGLRLSVDEIGTLRREYRQFACIKMDYVPPGPLISRLAAQFPDQFTYLIGFAGLQLEDALQRGAHGLMGGTGHVTEDVAAFSALRSGDSAPFRRLLPLLNLEMQTVEMSIALHKFLLHRRGVFACDHVRAPGAGLDPIWREQSIRLMEAV